MFKPRKENNPPIPEYPEIQRGTSFKLPIHIKNEDGTPVDLRPYSELRFTLKRQMFDFDYDDDRALISVKAKADTDWTDGRCYFPIYSNQTWLEPDEYYFDIELINAQKAVTRLVTMKTRIVGGPTNNTIDRETGEPEFFSDCIDFKFTNGHPLVFITNLAKQFAKPVVEQITVVPSYLWNNDNRNPIIECYASRLAFSQDFNVSYDTNVHYETINSPFLEQLKTKCPLYNTRFKIIGNSIELEGLPSNIDFKVFQNEMNTFTMGSVATINPTFQLKMDAEPHVNIIKVSLTDTTDINNNIVMNICVYCPPNIPGEQVHWNIETNWYYTHI